MNLLEKFKNAYESDDKLILCTFLENKETKEELIKFFFGELESTAKSFGIPIEIYVNSKIEELEKFKEENQEKLNSCNEPISASQISLYLIDELDFNKFIYDDELNLNETEKNINDFFKKALDKESDPIAIRKIQFKFLNKRKAIQLLKNSDNNQRISND